MRNIVVEKIEGEASAMKALEAPEGWVIMHACFGKDQASPKSAESKSGASRA